jgi:hypothetical protein
MIGPHFLNFLTLYYDWPAHLAKPDPSMNGFIRLLCGEADPVSIILLCTMIGPPRFNYFTLYYDWPASFQFSYSVLWLARTFKIILLSAMIGPLISLCQIPPWMASWDCFASGFARRAHFLNFLTQCYDWLRSSALRMDALLNFLTLYYDWAAHF